MIIKITIFCMFLLFSLNGFSKPKSYSISDKLNLYLFQKIIKGKNNLGKSAFLRSLALFQSSGNLRPMLIKLGNSSILDSRFEGIGEAEREKIIEEKVVMALQVIDGTLKLHGYFPGNDGNVEYESWEKISKRLWKPIFKMERFDVGSEQFKEQFQKLTNSAFTTAKEAKLLIDGPQAFPLREKIIENAEKSIFILTWAIYDDLETGFATAELLLKKLNDKPNIDIKIIVDEQMSKHEKHSKVIKKLRDYSNNRIKIMTWREERMKPLFLELGTHRKVMVVDGDKMIAGGMNIGNKYSHRGEKGATGYWRDTDIFATGNVAKQAHNLFIEIWNTQKEFSTSGKDSAFDPMEKLLISYPEEIKDTDKNMSIINHNPGPKEIGGDSNILNAYLYSIKSAAKTIDIENAYFLTLDPIKNALVDAIKRDVKVRILTNSDKSVDEPILSNPIQKSALEMFKKGAKIYLKKGSTLHGKLMVVDNKFTLIGSYNLHPRSYRYEGETVIISLIEKIANDMSIQFEKDISTKNATKINYKSDINVEGDATSKFFFKYFYDQL